METAESSLGQVFARDFEAKPTVVDQESRIIEVSFSSETPYTRHPILQDPWIERLGHNKSELDLSRLKNKATVHYNHSRRREDRIGVVLDAWIKDNRGYATIQISKRDDVYDVWGDIEDGLLCNVSVGYKINERKLIKSHDDGPDEYRVTNWQPLEISVVDIPADPTVGVGRSELQTLQSSVFSIPNVPAAADSPISQGNKVMSNKSSIDSNDNFRAEEQSRREEISLAFKFAPKTAEMQDFRERCMDDMNCSPDAVRKILLEEIGKEKTPLGPTHLGRDRYYETPVGNISLGGDRGLAQDAEDSLCIRSGMEVESASIHAHDLSKVRLVDLQRAFESQRGYSSHSYRSSGIGLSTSDFKNVLSNFAHKAIIFGYTNSANSSHRVWSSEGDLPDFKPSKQVAISEAPSLELINQGGEYKYGTLTDTGEEVCILTYGGMIAFTRQAIKNDDLGILTEAAMGQGESTARLEADLTYEKLISNPIMTDGTALFHADHNNLGTAAALSVTSLGEARKLLRNQKGLKGEAYLNPQPKYLIVPTSLETIAEQLLASIWDPAGNNSQVHNPFARKLELVVDPRLDADSETAWYLVADKDQSNFIRRFYLDGERAPHVEENDGWTVDGLEIKTRFDISVNALSWKFAVKNAGA